MAITLHITGRKTRGPVAEDWSAAEINLQEGDYSMQLSSHDPDKLNITLGHVPVGDAMTAFVKKFATPQLGDAWLLDLDRVDNLEFKQHWLTLVTREHIERIFNATQPKLVTPAPPLPPSFV